MTCIQEEEQDCALNCRQPWTTGNNFQKVADLMSPTVADNNRLQFNANSLWICIIFRKGKAMENQYRKTEDTLTAALPGTNTCKCNVTQMLSISD